MVGIPPSLDSDDEDVSWALQTAEALWKRGERADAVVWLRRAASAATEAQDDDRAFALARMATELTAQSTRPPGPRSSSSTPPPLPRASAGFPAPAGKTPVSLAELSAIVAATKPQAGSLSETSAFPAAARLSRASPVPAPEIDQDEDEEIIEPTTGELQFEPQSGDPLGDVPSAAEKHAGMLDPWQEDDEPTPAKGSLSPMASAKTPPPSAPPPASEVDGVVTSAPPMPDRGASPRSSGKTASARAAGVELSEVAAFGDLPEDARAAFGRAAHVKDLGMDEQIAGFSLALVLRGEVDLAAMTVSSPAKRLGPGATIRSRGTLDLRMPVRLIGVSLAASVALWDEDTVVQAFRTCPWVEDDLRAEGDRLQAEVGVTLGALGERLDPALRTQFTQRLKLRAMVEHEVFATQGEPIPGLLVVGAGELEIDGPGPAIPEGRALRAGEFLFPNEVLRAAPAPRTARAGRGGALVLFAERAVAQELLVTCPPLLEIFAGS